jgi:type II secretory ATPase GspE/PulE/Tfp pilus assembly ATPase PilB-like protein
MNFLAAGLLLVALAPAIPPPDPPVQARGGPDSFGYTWADIDETSVSIVAPAFVPTDLRNLGFDDRMLERMEHFTALPHGIFLVTGPTGSGKSTTLYSALKKINQSDKKIITIEDPVEYQMDGINQIHTRRSADFRQACAISCVRI